MMTANSRTTMQAAMIRILRVAVTQLILILA